jgi:hypothetical protein
VRFESAALSTSTTKTEDVNVINVSFEILELISGLKPGAFLPDHPTMRWIIVGGIFFFYY